MPDDYSMLVTNVLQSLIAVCERKTDHGLAVMTVDSLVKELEPQYNCLSNVQIQEELYTESGVLVSVMSGINTVDATELAGAIQTLIQRLQKSLGESAGYFFIKEVKRMLGDDNVSRMKDLGVDFKLLQFDDDFIKTERMLTRGKV